MIQKPDFKRYIAGLDDAAAGAAIAGAASIIGAGTSAVAQSSLNRKTREFNREEAEKQRLWSEEMYNKQNAWNYERWLEQNAYNSPEAQVQRLRDAGLNPLYYGLDGSSAQGVSAAQPLSYERAEVGNQINPFAGFDQAALTAAQVANVVAQTEKTKSETKLIDAKLPYEVDALKAQIRSSNLSSDAQEIVNNYLDRQQEAELRVKDATVAQSDAMIRKAFAEIEKMDYEKVSMMIGWLETQEKILTLQKSRELTDKQIDELESLIRVNNATASKIGLDVSNYDDVTVIGTASHNLKFGPFSVQEGQPITLAMKKAAEEHRVQLEKDKKDKSKHVRSGDQVSARDGSPYTGPVYD